MRLLLVEEDTATARMTAQLLGLRGHDVHTAVSAGQALEFALKHSFDAALLEAVVGETDGFELAGTLMRLQSRLRCIFLTGHLVPDGARRAQIMGAYFLTKPLELVELERLLALPSE